MHPEPTVFVVDEDASICELVVDLCRTLDVRCEAYTSGLTFLDEYDGSSDGCLVVEARMMGASGLQIQRRLVSEKIPLPVIVMTERANIPMVVAAMRNGAIEFLEKPFRQHRMWEAIQEALRLGRERSRMRRRRKELNRLLDNLTAREQEVLQMLRTGKANRGIAEKMGVCVRTIEMHRAKLMTKLEVRTLPHLVMVAELAAEPSSDNEKVSLVGPGRHIHSRIDPGDSYGTPADSLVKAKFMTE
ncbi:MAG: response regulator transcription factor [Candidatus Nealsonbacteria bacterium]|nr:response regulator transcription factor [Candidatus Nealsonbacteria bacterium]